MKPVDQHYFQGQQRPMGDCFRACLASIFELPLNDVPHFVEIQYQRQARHDLTKEWEHTMWGMLNSWAWSLGLGANRVMYKRAYRKPRNWHSGYWIASVTTRDPLTAIVLPNANHAVVMWGDRVKHDPNPDSRKVKKPYRFRGETWFELANPARLLQEVAR